MALQIQDRVKETTVTGGTGVLSLAGAMVGYQAFSSVCTVGDTCYYALQAVDASGNPTGVWEVGLGAYSSANTLSRTTVLASSSAGAKVSLAAGTKQVWIDYPAGAVLLANLKDALVVTPANGDLLRYNSTDAKWENFAPPSFRAISSAIGAAVVANTPQKVVINATGFDNRGWFSTANNRYTPQVAGKYRVRGHAPMTGTNSGLFSLLGYVYKNGTQISVYQFGFTFPTGGYTFSVAPEAIVDMNGTTDFLEFWVSCQSAGPQPAPGSVFEGHYIGP
jgi:hypothetical protein